MEEIHAFSSGAKSSVKKSMFHLLRWHVWAKRVADRFGLGAEKYGEENMEKGLLDREFYLDRANHLLEHAHLAVEKIRKGEWKQGDDDLSAVIWGAIFLMMVEDANDYVGALGGPEK